MSSEQKKDRFEKERGKTDVSLVAERGRTDESLFDLRKKTEEETDAKVKIDRAEADTARAQSRSETDVQQAADGKTTDQRHLADQSMQIERALMDTAIEKERRKKETLLYKFLERERGETDEDLLKERQETDSEFTKSMKLLDDETLSHTATKADLTTRAEFLAIVSHDLRNPVGAILSCSEMLLQDSTAFPIGEEATHWIKFIKRNAESSIRLISDILDMERIAQGKLGLQLRRKDVNELIQESIDSLTHSAKASDVTLAVQPLQTAMNVNCDPDRILQVLANLVSNAIKFSNTGTTIIAKAELAGDKVEISISDTGAGIAKEQQARIFERYGQINNKDRRGIGLGLYITKMLVEAHHGSIRLKSSLGKGSTFTFSLPANEGKTSSEDLSKFP